MAYKNAPFDELNFIDSFTETPSSKDGVSLRNLNVCSFSLCDFFSEESIQSFTPQPNYRYDVPYHPLSNVDSHPLHFRIERTKPNSRWNQIYVFPWIFELYVVSLSSSPTGSSFMRQSAFSTIRHSLYDIDRHAGHASCSRIRWSFHRRRDSIRVSLVKSVVNIELFPISISMRTSASLKLQFGR